ncbi:MAG: hypothetical protein IK074_03875, partial [Bacteroidales bacterium]|nr:hypothetical protein [Bacteroidales bacterium]
MKEFVKTMLAVICGYIVLKLIGFLFLLIMFGSAVAMGGGKVSLPKNGVLDLDMSTFTLAEQSEETPAPSVTSLMSGMEMVPAVGVRDAVQALKFAAVDPSIRYVLLRADDLSAGMADVEELRKALLFVRQSGKAVIAYTEAPGNGSYYLSSVADKIYMGSQHGG